MNETTIIKIVTIVTLGVICLASVVMLGVVAITTDRDLFRAEVLTYAAVALIAALGGVSWWQMHRHHWRLRVDRNGERDEPDR